MLKICVLWALLVPATAQMYKWVDEKGTTHYGERPPPGKKARKVEERLANPTPAPGTPVEPGWKDKELEFRGRRIEAEQARTKQKQQEATHREACNQARDLLVQAKSAQRLYRLNEKGERVYQSDEEHQASVVQMERLIAQRCR